MAHLLIIGASSGIGLHATRGALQLGHTVRALSRSADRINLSARCLEKFVGDALAQRDVTAALQGIDVVISALGVPLRPEAIVGPVDVFSASTRLLISAMQAFKTRRLICVTGYGAGESRASIGCIQRIPFELVLGRAYADKDRQERLVRRSRLDWTIVRPVILTDGPKTDQLEILTDPSTWRNGFVSRADVADFLVRQIDDNRYVGKAPVLRSPACSAVQ